MEMHHGKSGGQALAHIAAKAMTTRSERVLQLAKDEDWGQLSALGLPAVKSLLSTLAAKNWWSDKDLKMMTAALSKIGGPYVVQIARSMDALPRYDAQLAKVLGSIGDKRAIPSLVRALERNGDYVAVNEALARVGDEQVVVPLTRSILRGHSNSVWALHGLSKKIGLDIVDTLIQALGSSDQEVRSAAAHALGEIGDRRAIPSLINLLDHDEAMYVCAAAARALGEIGDRQAVPHIQNALDTKTFSLPNDSSSYVTPAVKAYREALAKL